MCSKNDRDSRVSSSFRESLMGVGTLCGGHWAHIRHGKSCPKSCSRSTNRSNNGDAFFQSSIIIRGDQADLGTNEVTDIPCISTLYYWKCPRTSFVRCRRPATPEQLY